MIPIALVARIELLPESMLGNPWAHDLAHEFLAARLAVERSLGIRSTHVIRAALAAQPY